MTNGKSGSRATSVRLVLGAIAVAGMGGCSADSVIQVERSTGRIDRSELVGDYLATTIVFVDGADTTDLRAGGAFFNLTLGENSGVAGRLFIPGAGPAGVDINADMAGAWTFNLVGQIVRFVQQAETFVRDSEWPASRDEFAIELRGRSVPPGSDPDTPGIEVVLRKG
jgi:hypothetical protein